MTSRFFQLAKKSAGWNVKVLFYTLIPYRVRTTLCFFLALFIVGTTSAQAPLLSRSSDFLRVDPRGDAPSWINDPLPFISHPARACVNEYQPVADYYRWGDVAGWVLEKTVVREYSEEHQLMREFQRHHDGPIITSETVFSFDRLGRMLSSSKIDKDASGVATITTKERSYSNGLCVKEIVQENSGEGNNVISRMDNILSFDSKGSVTNIVSKNSLGEDTYNTVVYDLSYTDNRLSHILQSSLDAQTGRTEPICRYYVFKKGIGEWEFAGLSTELYGAEGWTTYRKDSLIRDDRQEKVWKGFIMNHSSDVSGQVTKVSYDRNGNLTDFQQFDISDEKGQQDLIGHLHFEITYAHDQKTPLSIMSSYLRPDKSYANSLKVVFSSGKSIGSESIAVFPNPATDHCTVMLQEEMEKGQSIDILDARGATVRSVSLEASQGRFHTFDTSMLTPGTYYVQTKGMKSQSCGKLVVVR